MPIPLSDQIQCVERELSLRARMYPRWVSAGRLSEAKARHEMEALKELQAKQGPYVVEPPEAA